jgi:hypothetical protein
VSRHSPRGFWRHVCGWTMAHLHKPRQRNSQLYMQWQPRRPSSRSSRRCCSWALPVCPCPWVQHQLQHQVAQRVHQAQQAGRKTRDPTRDLHLGSKAGSRMHFGERPSYRRPRLSYLWHPWGHCHYESPWWGGAPKIVNALLYPRKSKNVRVKLCTFRARVTTQPTSTVTLPEADVIDGIAVN